MDGNRIWWSEIPGDIVCLIADKISFLEDYVRLCAVCRNWHLFASDHYILKKKFEFAPVLMLREEDSTAKAKGGKRKSKRKRGDSTAKAKGGKRKSKRKRGDSTAIAKRTFKSFISGKSYSIHLPEAAGRRCWGSQFGWIVTFGPADLELSLLNPFSRATIPLPSLRTLLHDFSGGHYDPNQRFIKAILTASPDSLECLVFLVTRPSINESVLGFAKPGISFWSRFEGPSDLNDVVYFKGNYYGCRRDSLDVVLIDVTLQPPRAVQFSVLPLVPEDRTSLGCYRVSCRSALEEAVDFLDYFYTLKYLVHLGGELCLVLRYSAVNKSHYFKIFTIDTHTKKWTRFFPLGENRCLFLGNNSTFFYEATTPFPTFQGNVVYFTQDDDLSPYSLDQGWINILTIDNFERSRDQSLINPSFWVTPHLQFSSLREISNQEDELLIGKEDASVK